jgi:Rab-GTPase-TBC domain
LIIVSRDLQRTKSPISGKILPQEDCKQLTNVLSSIAYILPQIGYCQGMNYVASALYADSQNEELTFNLFLSLLYSKNLMPLYSNNLPDYHLKSFILEALLKTYIP